LGLLASGVPLAFTCGLWSRKADSGGVEGWTRYRVIELRTLLPADSLLEKPVAPMVVAFAEGVRVIFVDTVVGVFAIDLSSEKARKVCGPGIQYPMIPFMSFYTPGMVLALR